MFLQNCKIYPVLQILRNISLYFDITKNLMYNLFLNSLDLVDIIFKIQKIKFLLLKN